MSVLVGRGGKRPAAPRMGLADPAAVVAAAAKSHPVLSKTAPSRGDCIGAARPWGRPAPGSSWVVWAGAGSNESESANRGFVPGQKVAASGEQCCTGVGEADIGAALVQDQPAISNGTIEAGLVFRRRALELIQERLLDLLDIDPAVLDRLEANEVAPASYPAGWWTVTAHGIPIRHFGDKGMAERYASDPEYRASVVSRAL